MSTYLLLLVYNAAILGGIFSFVKAGQGCPAYRSTGGVATVIATAPVIAIGGVF